MQSNWVWGHSLYEAFEQVDRMKTIQRLRDRKHRRQLGALDERVAELETELGRMSMLVCAMLQLGLEKKAFTPEELQAQIAAMDALDGAMDGELAPGWARGRTADDEPPGPENEPAPRSTRSVRDRLDDRE